MQWKDISSFSQGQKDRTPTTWELRPTPRTRICVHRHIYKPGAWFVSCEPWFDIRELQATDAEAAKRQAVDMVRNEAASLLSELRSPD